MSYETYGNDIILKDGDLIAGANGDLYTARDYEGKNTESTKFEGYYNILFSLTDALLTLEGDNVFHPTYGSKLYNLLSTPNSQNLKNAVKETVKESILKDSRVADVTFVQVEQKDSEISVKASVTLKGSSEVVDFIFPNFVIN